MAALPKYSPRGNKRRFFCPSIALAPDRQHLSETIVKSERVTSCQRQLCLCVPKKLED